MARLNLTNGIKAAPLDPGDMFVHGSDMFQWPPVTNEMRKAVLDILDHYNMSGTDITKKFEKAFADWHGVKYALGVSSGTFSLLAAMYGVGLGKGDELICPSLTYWASCAQALSLGASVVFADVEPDTLCLDPDDFERKITPHTKAVMVVHYMGHPADMDRILPIAKKHGIKVIEDVSHAHGALYKGRMCGTFGDAAGFSCMSLKSFALGEAGIMLTNDRTVWERAVIFGSHDRHGELTIPEYKALAGIPSGGYKFRMNQMTSAIGVIMVREYPALMKELDKAMNYFCDGLEGLPGIRPFRVSKWPNSTMGGWYCPHAHYRPEELDGLSVGTFCDAMKAEGVSLAEPGCNWPLHTHPLFTQADVYGEGRPTNRTPPENDFPVSNAANDRTLYVPWFKKFRPSEIDRYVAAYRKVIENHKELLALDKNRKPNPARWMLSPHLSHPAKN